MTIQEISRLTGLSIDVLRVWERRYGAIRPERLSNNRRAYRAADVRRAMLLRDGVQAGHTISRIAALEDDALEALLQQNVHDDETVVARLLELVNANNADALFRLLDQRSRAMAPEKFCDDIISPMLRVVGEYWLTDPALIAKEHLASATVMRVLSAHAPSVHSGRAPLIFTTIPSERHVIGTVMAAFVAERHGYGTVTPVTGTTPDEIVDLARQVNAGGVGVSAVYANAEHTIRRIAEALDGTPIWVGGAKAADGPWARFTSMRDFGELLSGM